MLENIRNTITRLQRTDCDTTWVLTSHHVPDMSAMMRLPQQRPLPSNGALNIPQLWRLEAEHVNQFRLNLVYNSKFDNSDSQVIKY